MLPLLVLQIEQQQQFAVLLINRKEDIMKKLFVVIALALLAVGRSSITHANGVDGLIVGSGSGAILGQAIGRNAEATVIGATVGGLLGVLITSDLHAHRSPPPPMPEVHYRDYRSTHFKANPHRHFDRPFIREKYCERVSVFDPRRPHKRQVEIVCSYKPAPSPHFRSYGYHHR
jgi:hypothetical protein